MAAVTGTGQRWCFGNLSHRPRDQAIAALREETTDPVVLGFAMGSALATLEIDECDANPRWVACRGRTSGPQPLVPIVHGDDVIDWLSIAGVQRILTEAGVDLAELETVADKPTDTITAPLEPVQL
ncbi:hypothetical protein [Actinoplanes sp. NPDC049316]|uniref:hypothetical protein n=1 Tax=Actinoplanes sp. NPDC049316 TaxID=3154727 RepID=UPI003432459D